MEAGRGNALSPMTIMALSRALYDVEQSDARALVLTGKGKVFCAGLDLREAIGMDRSALAAYVDQFEALFLQVFAYRLPIVAALNGHALAGGAVIALACDWRVASSSQPMEFGLNETMLALPFPSAAFGVARFAVPPHHWTDAITLGERYSAEEAAALGLVHEMADDTLVAGKARAAVFLERGAAALQAMKADLRKDAIAVAHARAVDSRRRFVDHWFGEEAQRRLASAVERLRGN
jgi:enoyl-CoA hydratase